MKTPEASFKKYFAILKSADDWQARHQAMEALIVVAAFTQGSLPYFEPYLHELTICLLQQVANLRSAVSKTAVQLLGSVVAIAVDGAFDADLEAILLSLTKKLGEGNSWLNDEIERTITILITHCTNHKMLSALVAAADHKNPAVRGRIGTHMVSTLETFSTSAIEKLLSTSRETDKLIPVLVQLSGEGQAEARTSGKACIAILLPHWPQHERMVEKAAGHKAASRWKEVVAGLQKMGASQSASLAKEKRSGSSPANPQSTSGTLARRATNATPQSSTTSTCTLKKGATPSGPPSPRKGVSSGNSNQRTSAGTRSVTADPANVEILNDLYAKMCETGT